jgi:hypothetical protein
MTHRGKAHLRVEDAGLIGLHPLQYVRLIRVVVTLVHWPEETDLSVSAPLAPAAGEPATDIPCHQSVEEAGLAVIRILQFHAGAEDVPLHASFIAVCPQPDGSLLGVPFECHDHYLQSALMFSEQVDPAPADLCSRVADAFWGLLLAEPHDLPEYRDRMLHIRAGVWLVFGVEAGQPFIEEYDEEPGDERAGGPRPSPAVSPRWYDSEATA